MKKYIKSCLQSMTSLAAFRLCRQEEIVLCNYLITMRVFIGITTRIYYEMRRVFFFSLPFDICVKKQNQQQGILSCIIFCSYWGRKRKLFLLEMISADSMQVRSRKLTCFKGIAKLFFKSSSPWWLIFYKELLWK